MFKRHIYLPSIVLGCAVKMEGSTTKRVLSTMRVTLSEVLRLRAPSLEFSYTKTVSLPAMLRPVPRALQVPSLLDRLLFLLLITPLLLLEPLGEAFGGLGLLGRDEELASRSRSGGRPRKHTL